MNKRLLSIAVLAAFAAGAHAKLPATPQDDAAKAKAAETTAKAAWQAKIDAFQLCKTQDRIAAKFKGSGKSDAKVTPVVANGAKPPAAGASAPAAGASAPAAMQTAAGPAPCVDPGAFAWNPPEQKPLETSGAHSPTATSGSPPSVRPESAQMAPAKPSTAPSGGGAAAK